MLCVDNNNCRFGRRPVLLVSLYTSVLFTIVCSVEPNNYPALLIARLLIGCCVGLNISTSSVYMAELVSSHAVFARGTTIDSFFFAVGGGWIALLGYLLLDSLSWRVFVLFTSLPVYLPPIFILHYWLQGVERPRDDETVPLTNTKLRYADTPANFYSRLGKATVINFVNILQGFGSILLLPELLRLNNQRVVVEEDPGLEEFKCDSAVQGTQFLVLALITGGSHVLGRALGYILIGKIQFRVMQTGLAAIMATCYAALLIDDSVVTVIVAMGVANVVYSMTRLELKIMECDIDYFGVKNVAFASGVILGVGHLGAVLGTALAEFTSPRTAVLWTLVGSLVQILVVPFVDY